MRRFSSPILLVVLLCANGGVALALMGLLRSAPANAPLMPIATRRVNAPVALPLWPTLPPPIERSPTSPPIARNTANGARATMTTFPTATATPLFIPIGALPASALIEGITGQKQALPLSCESRSAVDWAAYHGVAIDEITFLTQLPSAENPDFGFVGDVLGDWGQVPPNDYGVHAEPVAQLLRSYGLRAFAERPLSWDKLRAEIAAQRPVIVWVVGHVDPKAGTALQFTDSQGRTTLVATKEHTVMVIGYSADEVTILDGAKTYTRPLKTFMEAWGILGQMAVMGWR